VLDAPCEHYVGHLWLLLVLLTCHFILPPVVAAGFAWGFWVFRKIKQSCLASCVVTASQATYNSAWLGWEFVLDYRSAGIYLLSNSDRPPVNQVTQHLQLPLVNAGASGLVMRCAYQQVQYAGCFQSRPLIVI
jgi:hypothetical protein